LSSYFYDDSQHALSATYFQEKCFIHRGSYFEVYKIRIGLKWYIRKGLIETYRASDWYIGLLHKEFEIGQRLSHPHIARYIYLGKDNNNWFIWIEYIKGLTLHETLQNPNKSFSTIKKIMRPLNKQLGSALDYIHKQGIYHGDLNPNNIIYNQKENKFYLIDFGHAHYDSFIRINGGTCNYTAPEVFDEQLDISAATDIYALGKIITLICEKYKSKKYMRLAEQCCFSNHQRRLQSIGAVQNRIRWINNKHLIYTICLLLTLLCCYFINLSTNDQFALEHKQQTSIPENIITNNRKTNTAIHPTNTAKLALRKNKVLSTAVDSLSRCLSKFDFLKEFSEKAHEGMKLDELRRLRQAIIVSHYHKFTIYLDSCHFSEAAVNEYMLAYNKKYYKQFLTSESIIQHICNSSPKQN
jgi:serine/threonine protein kinase